MSVLILADLQFDLRRLIHATRFELVEYRFLEPQFFEPIFVSLGGSKSRDSTVVMA